MNEGKITCTKRKGYLSDVRVRLLSAEGTISNETELKYSTHKELLNELGVKIKSGTSSKPDDLWQDFDILLKDIISNMTVECGARDPNELISEFYNSVAVIATPQPDDETEISCELTNSRVVGSISTLSVLLGIALVSVTVIMIVVLKFYCIHTVRRHGNQRGGHGEGEVMYNQLAMVDIDNLGVQQIGELMIGRNEPPAHNGQNVPPAPVDGQNVPPAPVNGQSVPPALVDEQIVPPVLVDGQNRQPALVDEQNVPLAPVDEQNIPLAPLDGQNGPFPQVIRVLPAEDR